MEKTKIKKIAIIIGVLLLPLIYSITYLKGFWDPYNNLSKMKVAVVNLDECRENCKSTDLIQKLKDSDSFGFVIKDKNEAEKGLLNKKYYATITIPKDFTSSFENAESADRKQPTIVYRTNKKTNYIASQLIENAVLRVEKQLDNEISKSVVKNLSNKLDSVPEETGKISNALDEIHKGSLSLNDGAVRLADGSSALYLNSQKISDGINSLNQGVSSLSDGTSNLKDGASKLSAGSKNLKTGIDTIKNEVNNSNQELNSKATGLQNGLASLNDGSSSLASNLKNYSDSSNAFFDNLKTYFNNVYQSSSDEVEKQQVMVFIGTINALQSGLAPINNGAGNLNTNIAYLTNELNAAFNEIGTNLDNLAYGLNELSNGSATLDYGVDELVSGINRLDSGVKVLDGGISQLNNNYSTFNGGVGTVSTSLSALKQGTKTLSDGVGTAKDGVDNAINETKEELKKLDGLDEYTANPVILKDKSYGKVDDYGTFFSPFFMSLSLWLGGILIIVGLYYDPEKRFAILGKNSSNRVKRLIYYTLIGTAQSIILPLVLVWTLHFNVTNWPLFFGSCVLIGLSFLSIMLFMTFNFDDVGKFLAIVLLVIQLAACAGTFPLETEPTFFKDISPFMPMTYSVELLRESFVSIDKSLLIKDAGVLIGILIVFGSLIVITGLIKTKKENKK